MKKIISAVLLLTLLLALAGCGSEEAGEQLPIMGRLSSTQLEDDTWTAYYASNPEAERFDLSAVKIVNFDSHIQMMLELQAGKIDYFTVPACTAEYILARLPEMQMVAQDSVSYAYRMALLPERAELRDRVNEALAALQADGTLAELIATYIDDCDLDPIAEPLKPLAVYADAPTVRVGVTGDKPPMDYIAADGTPAGFNVALFSAIGERLGVNVELVSITSAARLTALSLGSIDLCFWMEVAPLDDAAADAYSLLLTRPYYHNTAAYVTEDFPLESIKTLHNIAPAD